MDWSKRRKNFRKIVQGKKCVNPASTYDALSACIAEDLGFECGMYAGSIASLAVLGRPDIMVLTLSEFAEQAMRIGRASSLPLICEVDNGYGNALNVMRTVQELETAGVVAINLEDTVAPRPYGPSDKLKVVSIDEGVGKMRAALAAREDKSMVIAGRTRALTIEPLKSVIARCVAYEKAGVDAMFLAGAKTRKQLEAIRSAIKIPIFLGSVDPDSEIGDKVYLGKMGVRIALQGHLGIRASVQAQYDTLKALRDGTNPKTVKGIASAALMKKITREGDYQRWSKAYLGGPWTGH
ncbi:MAG: isocitrate lyase/PEP mutase family protein [Rhodospirillales bacterium]|jgi:carboxyvinyl-carboxyphosphonate phosphorylmutase